jgi:hypothetical protein
VRMRRSLFIISLILTAVSVILLLVAFSVPSQSEKKVTKVKYTHTGQFDYTVSLKPSYLFGPEPQKNTVIPVANPKYQADLVDHFIFSFNYNLTVPPAMTVLSQNTEVTVTGINEEGKQAEETLYPATRTGEPGPYATSFDLVPDDSLTNGDMTVTINVIPALQTEAGIIFDSFSQNLVIHKKGNVYEIERSGLARTQSANLGGMTLTQEGKLTYTVQLRANSPLGAVTIAPPATEESTSMPIATLVTNPATIFGKLVDRMNVNLNYNFTPDMPVRNVSESVTVNAFLENTDVWAKTFVLAATTNESGNFQLNIPVDMPQIMQTLDNIRSELGISSGEYKLTLQAEVKVTGLTDFGPISDIFSPTLTTSLDKGIIQWEEDRIQSKTGSLDKEEVVTNTGKYLGMDIDTVRIVLVILLALFIISSLYFGWLFFTRPAAKQSAIEKERRKIYKKYGGRIVETVSSPKGWSTVNVISMEDLIKISDELGKPITSKTTELSEEKYVFSVLDGSNCYQYVLEDTES